MEQLKRTLAVGAFVVASLSIAGCQEPEGIVTAAPPGIDQRSLLEIKETDEAQALGETATKSSGEAKPAPVVSAEPALPTAKGETKTTASGVKYETVKEGTGAVAKAGNMVTVHYVGTLEDGRKFDSSRDRSKPAEFSIGTGAVIRGWDEAVPGMKIGEIRKLIIPPSAGYGALGKGQIPPNAVLHFEIELINVQ